LPPAVPFRQLAPRSTRPLLRSASRPTGLRGSRTPVRRCVPCSAEALACPTTFDWSGTRPLRPPRTQYIRGEPCGDDFGFLIWHPAYMRTITIFLARLKVGAGEPRRGCRRRVLFSDRADYVGGAASLDQTARCSGQHRCYNGRVWSGERLPCARRGIGLRGEPVSHVFRQHDFPTSGRILPCGSAGRRLTSAPQ